MGNSRRTTSIHVLDDNSLLYVFYLCRPFFRDDDDIEDWRYKGRWWYAPAHVCRRWRNTILGSATYLGLSLLCTYGTPVADMLEHSPPLPLMVGYFKRNLTREDEEGIILALKQHHRVRRIRLSNPVAILQKFIAAMDEEYPILEYLYIAFPTEDNSAIFEFPETLRAPHLRRLTLKGFALPIGSRLLTASVGLVTLRLDMVHPSTYFHPNTLHQWISLMPQLEVLAIYFETSIPNRDVERQLMHTSAITPLSLPNLRHFEFYGVSTYLEALVCQITTPRLRKLKIGFFNQLSFSVPRLQQFIYAAENLRFDHAAFTFSDKKVSVAVYPRGKTNLYALGIVVKCWHLDWRVSSMAQISDSLGLIFSVVEDVAFRHEVHRESSELDSEAHKEVDRTEWRKLLRPFNNAKTLRIEEGLVEDFSRALKLEVGEYPLELLPELQGLTYFGSDDTGDAFTSFIDIRRNAGRPVTLVRR